MDTQSRTAQLTTNNLFESCAERKGNAYWTPSAPKCRPLCPEPDLSNHGMYHNDEQKLLI